MTLDNLSDGVDVWVNSHKQNKYLENSMLKCFKINLNPPSFKKDLKQLDIKVEDGLIIIDISDL
jgi:hypothetical protein